MKSARRSDVDTISNNLPCDILDGILGRLPLKDAVKSSILSKDWRYKWATRQELEFDYHFFKSFSHVQEAKTIIYQVLVFHKGPILKFRLGGSNLIRFRDIDHWILFLSKKNVEEFTLRVRSNNDYHLPSHLLTFRKLRLLEVQNCLFHPPPDFKGFKKLVNLGLHCVTFLPTVLSNLISRSPFLEILKLNYCTNFDTLEIDAANLKCFEFRGTSKSICFKNAPMLKEVTIWLNSQVSTDLSPVCSNLINFLYYMPCLMELDISGVSLKDLTMGGLSGNSLIVLNNVKSLRIRRMLFENSEEVSGAVYLIASCPKLQELTIECEIMNDVVGPVAVVQYLQDHQSLYGAVKLLRRVHMNTFSGFEIEMEFVRLILASAPALEKIFFWNFSCFLHQPGRQLMDKMKQFHQASPNVEFTFEEVVAEDRRPIEPQEAMEAPYDFD
ncbi:F-box/FBD/LRR-repeat protein At1g13570-like [Solanum stenotomum]|uniref:F-box/FBD/LRR-repeat protein At1g13570-like n=1 Tax=Solanum stenotomum TaxID=172797 RepID=UPI0020D1DC0E|nr:F-box/FBD/LRR-repeat protein At1g13570-like [Solanum stenotomum]